MAPPPASRPRVLNSEDVLRALNRASEKARQLAEQTGTRFVVRESAVTRLSKRKLSNIHPGEVLRDEFLIPYDLSQSRLAREIGVSHARICAICSGKRAITADTALRLAAFFGTSSGFWLGLQADYDTEEAAKELTGVLAQIHRFEPLAA
jgi:addiction module HigA family antidote